MEDRCDLIPFPKPDDLMFFWKGYDTWKLAIFDVIEDARFAFITGLEPYTGLKFTPDKLWRFISTSLVPLAKW